MHCRGIWWKGSVTSPLALLDADQFFISLIENYSHIFTSFDFPDQYLKTKGYSEKWPTSFLEPASQAACLYDIAYGKKRVKCPMPYSLLASHCRQCRDCLRWPRQVWSPGSVGSRRPWGWWWGAQWPVCVPTQDPSVTAPLGETALLWNLVPPEDRAPSVRLRDGWPVWPRTSHCWWIACSCLSWWWALLATARVWPFDSPHCLLAVDWAGFSIPPSSGGRNTWVLSLGKNLGLLVLGKGCEGRRDRCVGLEGASQAWNEFLLLSFLCIGRMNRKTNRCLQYNTCIKSNNK